jgi:ABC-type glycerol-3-phosphate transport system substrate-binding protein
VRHLEAFVVVTLRLRRESVRSDCQVQTRSQREARVAAIVFTMLVAACSGTTSTKQNVAFPAPLLPSTTMVELGTVASNSAAESSVPTLTRECFVGVDATNGPVEIVFWHQYDLNVEQAVSGLVEDFDRRTAGVSVKTVKIEGTADLVKRLQNGERPDVLAAGTEVFVNLIDSGVAIPASKCIALDPKFNESDLLPLARQEFLIDDQLWAVPVSISAPVVVFDAAKWMEAGVSPPKVPLEWAALQGLLQPLMSTGVFERGLIAGDGGAVIRQLAAQTNLEIIVPSNGHVADRSALRSDFINDSFLTDLLTLRDLSTAKLLESFDDASYADLRELVDPSGAAVGAIQTSGSLGFAYDTIDAGSFGNAEVGVMALPGSDRGLELGGAALWLTPTSDDPEVISAAWSLISELGSTADQATLGRLGYIPSRMSALEDPALRDELARRPGLNVAIDGALASPVSKATAKPVTGVEIEMSTRLELSFQRILDGSDPLTEMTLAGVDIDQLVIAYATLRS